MTADLLTVEEETGPLGGSERPPAKQAASLLLPIGELRIDLRTHILHQRGVGGPPPKSVAFFYSKTVRRGGVLAGGSAVGLTIKAILSTGAVLPSYETLGSAGADLCAKMDSPLMLEPGARALIPTGLKLQIPVGHEGQVRPRSGLAAKQGITVLNSPGTIDADFRGEIHVILINLGSEAFVISSGDRIAQLVIAPVIQADFTLASSLDASRRGDGGFGSTGV